MKTTLHILNILNFLTALSEISYLSCLFSNHVFNAARIIQVLPQSLKTSYIACTAAKVNAEMQCRLFRIVLNAV